MVLHAVTEKGSIGSARYAAAFQSLHLRGSCWHDPFHRRRNWFARDLRRCQAWEMRLETDLIMSCRKGPWLKSANFFKLSKTAEEYWQKSSEGQPLPYAGSEAHCPHAGDLVENPTMSMVSEVWQQGEAV
eukprot:4644177-Amphidinium_carterae.3